MLPALLLAAMPAWAGTLTVDVLDVGQGDAILLQSPAGKRVLIDAGTGKEDVVPMLRARGIDKLDLVIASHAHADHIGGMDEVLEAVPVKIYVDQGMPHTTGTYTKVMGLVESKGAAYKPGKRGVAFNLDDGIRIELLAPFEPPLSGTRSDLNSNSVVVRLTKGDQCMLFTGDSEEPTEHMLLQKGLEPCQVLKVAHHGSGHSSTQHFLDTVKPEVALISCGVDNKYKHPYPETLERLARVGAAVYRTDELGTIRVKTDGTSIQVVPLGKETGARRPMDPDWTPPPAKTVLRAGEPPPEAQPPARNKTVLAPAAPAAASVAPVLVTKAPVTRPEKVVLGGGKLDLNAATAAQLDALPGIGPAKAQAIIAFRESNGPFTSLDQLDAVPGIGPATIAGLRARIVIAPADGAME